MMPLLNIYLTNPSVSDRHSSNNIWAIKIFKKKLVLWLYIIPNMLCFVTNDNRMQSQKNISFT